jgi:hypothetical protein
MNTAPVICRIVFVGHYLDDKLSRVLIRKHGRNAVMKVGTQIREGGILQGFSVIRQDITAIYQ